MLSSPYSPGLLPIFPDNFDFFTNISYEKKLHYADGGNVPEHMHDVYEIYVHIAGEVSFLVEDTVYPIGYGDIVLTKPNAIHKCIYLQDCIHEHFCIWLKGVPSVSELFRNTFDAHSIIVLPEESKKKFVELCVDFRESFLSGREDLRFRSVHSFFGMLDMICMDNHEKSEPQVLPAKFFEIVEHISEHFREPGCTVNNICDTFYISKSTLCRQFRQYFRTTPSDYIESKRFSEAKKLLFSGQSVQSVCFNCGFSDCSYFIMRFRKRFGITPYKYQKTAQ